jgi:hypothetical protein
VNYQIYSRQEILAEIHQLTEEYNAILSSLTKDALKDKIPGKWSIAEHIEHLINTNTVTALAFLMPKSALGMTFGKQSGSSRSIESLIHEYQYAIVKGAGSPLLYVPKIPLLRKSMLTQLFNSSIQAIEQVTATWTEEELDTYLLPHPILGKITAREMLGLTAYHLYHHLNIIKALAIYATV